MFLIHQFDLSHEKFVTAHIFCTFQGSRARCERNAQHTEDTQTGFVSCKSVRF